MNAANPADQDPAGSAFDAGKPVPDADKTLVGGLDDEDALASTNVAPETVVGGGSSGGESSATGRMGAGKPVVAGPQKITQLGDFRLIRKLGEGGMGEVYLAHQDSLDRKAAIKVLSKKLAGKEDFVKRFYREARSMAKIDHPNAVRVFAVDQDHGVHFVAMEFIDGKSMQHWVETLGKLSVGDAIHVTLRCAEALQHAHAMNMVHRDIKPDNIMLTSRGQVKVADFGLAKALDDEDNSLTQSGTGLGTPYYMAPEQARNAKHVDGRCDIYAMGVTLYHFLTGKLPFSGNTTIELIMNKEQGKFPPARKANPDVPEKLDLIIDKMVAVSPEQRFKDFGEVARHLSALGLENPSLSFIQAPDKVVVSTSTTSSVRNPAVATRTMPGLAKSSAEDAASQKQAAVKEVVYAIQFIDAQGKPSAAKMTAAAIFKGVKAGIIDQRAKVKKPGGSSAIPIAQLPEFEDAIRGLVIRQEAEKKGRDMKSLYAQIDKQERWRKFTRKIKAALSGALGWVSLLIWLGLVAGAVYGIYLLIPLLRGSLPFLEKLN
ncbi:MAG: serine/threonine protein kinase [Planctomyces sp.]|nr:serine/threonine protein kinase [Planctomyces sp.]